MSGIGKQVVATEDRGRPQVIVSGSDLVDLVTLAETRFRVLGSGAIVIDLDDLGALEVACATRRRPIRIRSRKVVTE